MKLALVIMGCVVVGGCQVAHYNHSTFDANGKPATSVDLWVGTNAFDGKATTAKLSLPDGTALDLENPAGGPDANVVSATSDVISQTVAILTKALGVP